MRSEAQKRADRKYKSEKVRGIYLAFYPGEYLFLEKMKEAAKIYGGVKPYLKKLVEKDLGL